MSEPVSCARASSARPFTNSQRRAARTLVRAAACACAIATIAGAWLALATHAAAADGVQRQAGSRALDAEQVELFVHEFYDRLEALDYPALRERSTAQLEILSQSTPEFEILGEGLRIGHARFEQQIASARAANRKLQFKLTQFRTVVDDDVAYTSYMLHFMPDDRAGLGEMVLRRQGGRWLLDRLTHMPFYPGYPE